MSYSDLIKKHSEWIENTYEKIDKKLSKVAVRSREKLPYSTKNGVHVERKPFFWTSGFWGGLMCLMYQASGKEVYKDTAFAAQALLDKAFSDFDELHTT